MVTGEPATWGNCGWAAWRSFMQESGVRAAGSFMLEQGSGALGPKGAA